MGRDRERGRYGEELKGRGFEGRMMCGRQTPPNPRWPPSRYRKQALCACQPQVPVLVPGTAFALLSFALSVLLLFPLSCCCSAALLPSFSLSPLPRDGIVPSARLPPDFRQSASAGHVLRCHRYRLPVVPLQLYLPVPRRSSAALQLCSAPSCLPARLPLPLSLFPFRLMSSLSPAQGRSQHAARDKQRWIARRRLAGAKWAGLGWPAGVLPSCTCTCAATSHHRPIHLLILDTS
jgi:hypothetical protein